MRYRTPRFRLHIFGFALVGCLIVFVVAGMAFDWRTSILAEEHDATISGQIILPGLPEHGTIDSQQVASASQKTTTASAKPSAKPVAPGIQVPVLMYHYVRYMYDKSDTAGYALSVPPNVFDQEMAYLKMRGFTTITPEDLYNAITLHSPLPAKPILLTFDDGYADFAAEAMPVMKTYGDKSTVFIPTDLMGTPNYLTWDQIRAIAKDPNVTIAAHTRRHANLVQIPQSQLDDEIVTGKALLEAQIGRRVDFFAYPYGAFNSTVIGVVKKAGFKAAFSTIEGRSHSINNLYALRRVAVPGTEDLAQFAALVGP